MVKSNNQQWWKEAVVYQVYPRSFKDSNGDGIGDLAGIVQKLDYIQSLGADMVWLSPIYASPNDDMGYDISDYQAIMAEFGTMEEFDNLLEGLHQRGIKLMLDMVVNHSSDEHPWFLESKSSKDSPKRSYYIWEEGTESGPPNNWGSFFSFSAWEKDDASGEYYLHLFSKKQPDLNWKNPVLREEIYQMMRWWLDKGVDGFRLDVVNLLAKPVGLPNIPNVAPGHYKLDPDFYANNPGSLEYFQEMHQKVFADYDIATVGECVEITPERALNYSKTEHKGLDMSFLLNICWANRNYLSFIHNELSRWYEVIAQGGWLGFPLGAHDYSRVVSRMGNDQEFRDMSAKLLAIFLLTAPGTPFLYQGDEIGMGNVDFDKIEDYNDIMTVNMYHERVARGEDPSQVFAELKPNSRDNSRTPMHWDASPHAGFSSGDPWLKVNPEFPQINVAMQEHQPDSILNFYRRTIQFRKAHPVFVYGSFNMEAQPNQNLVVYQRDWEGQSWKVLLNFSEQSAELGTLTQAINGYSCVYGNTKYGALEGTEPLVPWEARVYRKG